MQYITKISGDTVMNDFIKKDWDKYLVEIQEKLNQFKDLKEKYGQSFDAYSYQMLSKVERFDRIIHSLEDYFKLNKIRELQYPYIMHVKSDLQDIFMPANRASSIVSAMQKALRAFNAKTNLNLVNVLRGSTILCFDYSEENYFDEKFNREELSEKFTGFCQELSSADNNNKLNDFLEGDSKKRNSLLNTIKNITPTPGGSDNSVDIIVEYSSEPIRLTQEIRKNINIINPAKENNPQVDWENQKANGYVREINDMRKSFILFESAESEDEGTKLIKIYYKEDSQKNHLLQNFKDKKVNVSFSKKAGKYIAESLS